MRPLTATGKPMRALRALKDTTPAQPLTEKGVWLVNRHGSAEGTMWHGPLAQLVERGLATRSGRRGGYEWWITDAGRAVLARSGSCDPFSRTYARDLSEALNSSPGDTAASPAPLSTPTGGAGTMPVAASGIPAAVGRLELGAAPDPVWLRQLAETLKLEAALLEGHGEAVHVRASVCLFRANEALLDLVVALEGDQ